MIKENLRVIYNGSKNCTKLNGINPKGNFTLSSTPIALFYKSQYFKAHFKRMSLQQFTISFMNTFQMHPPISMKLPRFFYFFFNK